MKFWSVNDVFSAPWRCTTEAAWKKYPNDEQTHVKSIDVLDRRVTDDGRLLTTRLFGSQFNYPRLITSLLGLPEMQYAIEYSEVDLKTQTMILRQVNSTWSYVLSVDESIVYTPSRENSNLTNVNQSAKISINNRIIPMPGYFENMIVNNFEKNSAVGRSVVQKTVSTLGVGVMIGKVTQELRELSEEIDTTAIDLLSDKMSELAKDLDRASSMINNEIQCISSNLQSEMLQIIDNLETELSQISLKVNLSKYGCTFESSKSGLLDAVMRAGITVKPLAS